LVALLAQQAVTAFGRRTWTQVKRELVVGSSIADLVLFSNAAAVPFNEPLSVKESVVLAAVRQRGITTMTDVARISGDPKAAVARRLASKGFFKIVNDRITAVRRWWTRCSVVAIEAKLSRWRDALDQACAYRAYADASYVALPEASFERALGAEDAFLSAGVGLLSVSTTGVRILVRAHRPERYDWRREFACSRLATASN
jgi:hypothetical protein